ncbi:glycine C-acetyltransferase [Spelaeicoccus albus]|uniref:2-amino-3-ketobutyrate coenzyme A ligase n=1 Tax=Spelaeicoccus albus TaxID=1280376 RepID=A0A7Z0IHE1_9MICO|nr:glycine C-acetyltransferase [Spelaeicoccus albus]NYI67596.1 glycine C-acetyltransferase [Spelaeicoccus albus]
MYQNVKASVAAELAEIDAAGLYKHERRLDSPQSATITTAGKDVLNFCANNYLGLADHPDIIAAAHAGLDERGFGMASVRFICGTQTQHTELEHQLADFLGTEDSILFSSCFDANGGVFETLLSADDAVISDALNHASLIDGIRLSKARRLRYSNRDMGELEQCLIDAKDARRRMIVTDGVFSMDGYVAPLADICDLAEKYDALVLVDDSHAVGFVGDGGRGSHEYTGTMGRVDIITGTLGKALGGASGGYIAAPREIVDLLRQRARPYLFSNAVAPAVVAGSIKALELARESTRAREQLTSNTKRFREGMTAAGFEVLPGEHPICAVMFRGDDGARQANEISAAMLERGIYVIAFSYPVVPKGLARIRVQLSAAHSAADVDACIKAFTDARDARAAQ